MDSLEVQQGRALSLPPPRPGRERDNPEGDQLRVADLDHTGRHGLAQGLTVPVPAGDGALDDLGRAAKRSWGTGPPSTGSPVKPHLLNYWVPNSEISGELRAKLLDTWVP